MRKEYFAKILASVQNTVNESMDGSAELSTDTLTEIAKAYGFVEGKRGRDGGYQATDAGLTFIGENVEAFLVAEAQADATREVANKEARKVAAKAKAEALETQLRNALQAA